jgi:hypothetical protein
LSDGVATLWSTATLLFALRARRKVVWALAAGAAFGMAVLVRPTNVLLLLPLLFALPLRAGTIGLFFAGGLPFGGIFAWYSHTCYGHFYRTGYGGFLAMFDLGYFPARIRYYTLWISKTLSPLPLIAWLGLLFDRKPPQRDRALLLVWFGVFLVFYCFFVVYEQTLWTVRYVEPGSPAMILGALIVTRNLLEAIPNKRERPLPWRPLVALSLLLIVVVTAVRSGSGIGILSLAEGEAAYPRACQWVSSHLPERSLVVSMAASGALEYYTKTPYARYDWISAEQFKTLRPHVERHGYRWFALIFSWEAEDLQRNLPGRWRKLADIQNISAWELGAP